MSIIKAFVYVTVAVNLMLLAMRLMTGLETGIRTHVYISLVGLGFMCWMLALFGLGYNKDKQSVGGNDDDK
jgi:uncharacterized membrane-anchored protein YitT (DUF2179 family)